MSEHWRVTPPDGSTPIAVDLLVTPQPAFIPGETVEYEFLLLPRRDDTPEDYQQRQRTLLGYERIAGAYASGLDARRRPWFHEQHPTGDSVVVAIQPPDAKQTDGTGRGLWGLVESVGNLTNLPQTQWGVGFSVEYLAEFDEYDSERAARNAMEA